MHSALLPSYSRSINLSSLVPAPAVFKDYIAFRNMAPIDPASVPAPGTQLRFAQIEPWLISRCTEELHLRITLRGDGYVQILMSSIDSWRYIFAAVLPETEDLRLLGLIFQTYYRHQKPVPGFMIGANGVDLPLFGKSIVTCIAQLRQAQHSDDYPIATEAGLKILEGASQPLSNHRKLDLIQKKAFTIISGI